MASVFWDTNLFIYLIEQRPRGFYDLVVRAREQMLAQGDQLVTSALTLGEVLVQPLRAGRDDLAKRYSDLINEGALVVSLDPDAAKRYAKIRADNPSVRPPDAVQLATAAHHGVSLFVTNDRRLSRVRVPGVGQIAALEAVAP